MTKLFKSRGKLAGERGQSLVIALMVMFLLVFIGVVFVLVVAKNQGRTARSKDVLEAQYLAEAGINYADTMLRTSEDGADWRPTPSNRQGFRWDGNAWIVSSWNGTAWVDDTSDLIAYASGHPDFRWIKPYSSTPVLGSTIPGLPASLANVEVKGPDGGYTSFDMGKGRYLLRVSYNPETGDPTSKYLKIESIGRIGVIDRDDPTTWISQKLRRELTAYKPIGITDYLRFVGNREHRRSEIALGSPDVPITYGYYNTTSSDYRTAPIRVNGNLTWYGKSVDLYLSRKDAGSYSTPESLVEVSGDITCKADTVNVNEILNGLETGTTTVATSSDNSFLTTANGLYRDGASGLDAGGNARQIKRIEPPVIDSSDTPTKVPRYVTLTKDSGKWVTVTDTSSRNVSSGRYGWGAGVYIDNRDDLQPESETLFGGYTPRADWMHPNNRMKPFWQGPYYVPPAVVITLNPYDTDGDDKADMTITYTDIKGRSSNSQYGRKVYWYDAGGRPIKGFDPIPDSAGNPRLYADGRQIGSTITIPYPVGTREFYYWKNDTNDNGSVDKDELEKVSINGNGVVYAEGNIRIRGMLPGGDGLSGSTSTYAPVQLTVVSGGIIYIDGNLLKFRYVDSTGATQVDERCAISLLAKEYICVNTTQFVSLLTSTGPGMIGSDSGTGDPPYHLIVSPEPTSVFASMFSFGPSTGLNTPTPMLFSRQAGQYGASYINMWLNQMLVGIAPSGALGNDYVYGTGDPRFCAEGTGLAPVFEHKVWDIDLLDGLNRATNATVGAGNLLYKAPGIPNYFEVALDQSSMTRSNYLLSLFTIQPMDIRIEAAMFAQNRSFYIIPGNWFNQDPNDVVDPKKSRSTTTRPRGVDQKWPFFGEALDIRITIDGAITENLPAPIRDVSEWYSKWSKIPSTYGSSSLDTAHYDATRRYGEGLTFLYDPKLGWPVYNNTAIRTDDYGRPLPVTPCLPVCESLIYYGEPT